MTTLNIGNEAINSEEIAQKVRSDIAFLSDRLILLENQHQPNPIVIQTYQGMLESRQAVLAWLLQDNKKASNA
jgi:hypothetical protein